MRWASWYYWHANQRFFECQKIMSVWQAPCFVIMTVNINLMKRILRNFEYNYYQGEICRKTILSRDLFYRWFFKWDEREILGQSCLCSFKSTGSELANFRNFIWDHIWVTHAVIQRQRMYKFIYNWCGRFL